MVLSGDIVCAARRSRPSEDRVDKHYERRPKLETLMDDLKPSFVNYRSPQDDKIQLAF